MSGYNPKPVAYCILNADMDKCEHIEYGVLDAPLDSIKLYDQYAVERLQKSLERAETQVECQGEYIKSLLQPEANVQALEPSVGYSKKVAVKFKDKHVEHHIYSHAIEQDNLIVIKEVSNMFPKGTVTNVMIVEKV